MPTAEMSRVDGAKLRLRFHPGQMRAWNSTARRVVVLAGTQGGKTSWGPFWLHREILARGPGDYLVVAPTFKLLTKKLLPEFIRLFEQTLGLGHYSPGPTTFNFSIDGHRKLFGAAPMQPTRVLFGHARNSDSLESMTVKAAWLDEAGQKEFRQGSYEAVNRRLAIHRGRLLVTTTPYNLGWLKAKLYDPWERAKGRHPEIDVIRFDSTQNPAFPREEFEAARRDLPLWKFNLFYRAMFSRPAGMVYDCWDSGRNTVSGPFRPPASWPQNGGMDFGLVNTAAVLSAEEHDACNAPTGRHVVYKTYHPGETRTEKKHIEAILPRRGRPPYFVGGAGSEGDWRDKFRREGLPIAEPVVSSVDVGISTVYAMLANGTLVIADDLVDLIEEIESYSRVTDEEGNVGDEIDDAAGYHILDALRYLCTRIGRVHHKGIGVEQTGGSVSPAGIRYDRPVSQAPDGVFGS